MPTIEEIEAIYSGLPRNTIQYIAEFHRGRDTEHGQYADGLGLV